MKSTGFPILFAALLHVVPAVGAPVDCVEEQPVSITALDTDSFLVDFGRVAFGNLKLIPPANARTPITVHFGEDLVNGRINRSPPRTVRYQKVLVDIRGGEPIVVEPPPDERNTDQDNPNHPPAILTPEEWGVVLPFRWVEIESWQDQLGEGDIVRRSLFSRSWNDNAASFESSDPMLNRIWELSRYSIKATSFAGVYVDGDRERIPYEADAYLNQLSHYASDNDIQMARDTFEHLMAHPTWPTEWAPHMVFMAYTDWMHTGDVAWLGKQYAALESKLLLDRKREDGLIQSNTRQISRTDIVDWPATERDGFVFTAINTVVNAFHLRAMKLMAELARALGNDVDKERFSREAKRVHLAFQAKLFDSDAGIYRDGSETEHSSLHANLFPLAFELVPEEHVAGIVNWLEERGMRCSVYAAQYLLEGLFENGAATAALDLITAPGDRSWRHMVESGATITWEAWDHKYKPNQDWNHAWGAAPANLLPRYVLGAQPLAPGWEKVRIRPRPGNLAFARGKVPTPSGPILIDWERNKTFKLILALPDGIMANVEVPPTGIAVYLDGQPVPTTVSADYLRVVQPVTGQANIEVRPR